MASISKTRNTSLSMKMFLARMMNSDPPLRFGTATGHSGWRWDKDGVGMGGKNSGPGTEAKDGLGKGKEYKNPEYFNNEHYSFYDQEKELVDSEKRLEQPQSGLSDYWSKI